MKLKLNKNNIKNLSNNKKELPVFLTAEIAGGTNVHVVTQGTESSGCAPSHGPGEMDRLPPNTEV